MQMRFPTAYNSIIEKINRIDPISYARNRNFIDGNVTGLSPYISRGVISLPMIAFSVLRKHHSWQIEKFLQELAWREYWQSVWQNIGEKIFTDIKQQQQPVLHHEMVSAIVEGSTGIEAIDNGIQLLYQSGYMHNHLRMYTASVACNIAKAHWLQSAQWMYYHLLDGDIASNTLSWQWVAGCFSSKKYFCNQENINRFTYSNQQHSFLDYSYEELAIAKVPEHLRQSTAFQFTTELPLTAKPFIKPNQPVLLYNSYNLDPLWHSDMACNRILLLEPSHFKKNPVSKNVVQFILSLSANIPGIQIFTGEWEELKQLAGTNNIIFKKHPAFYYYTGREESYDKIFPDVHGYFPSFSGYWKHCTKHIPDLVIRALADIQQ